MTQFKYCFLLCYLRSLTQITCLPELASLCPLFKRAFPGSDLQLLVHKPWDHGVFKPLGSRNMSIYSLTRLFGFSLIPGGLLPIGLVLPEVIMESSLPGPLSKPVLSMNCDANWSIFSLEPQCLLVLRVSQVSISTSEFQSIHERPRLLVY